MSRHSLSRYQSLVAGALVASLIVASCSVNSEDASSDDVEQPVAANLDGEPSTGLPNEEQPGEIVDQPQTINLAISELLNVIAIEGRFVPAYVDPISGDVIVLAGPDSEQETVRKIGSLDFEGVQHAQ